ncbi:MAG: ABC transporter permease [Planctomycetaceae bacterium]|jgi:ABC-type transport system involved in multi-copper enzyme maturation permease subunit
MLQFPLSILAQAQGMLTPKQLMLAMLQDNAYILGGIVAVVVGLLAVLYGTRTGVIARATTKESVRQPIFSILLVVALVLLVVNTYVPFFSFGEDLKMMVVCGLATLKVCGMFLAVWSSSTSIADEIEGKTAMTMLSKPITRRQFIVGKFLGIQTAVLLLCLPVILAFGGLILYKVFYDAREATRDDVNSIVATTELLRMFPAIVLSLMEIMIMSAVSVMLSTRVPMVVNLVACLAIFLVGHLQEVLVSATLGRLELVGFVAKLIAIFLPAVGVFNVEAKLMADGAIPNQYVGLAAIYTAAYVFALILGSFLLFEDRDLA